MTIDCPYRKSAIGRPDDGVAVCGLLQKLTGAADERLCEVGCDACRSCCTWFPPAPRHINPVVASLLYNLSSRILAQGGVSGCDRDRALQLNELASRNIPAEEDCVAVAAETRDQANLECTDLAEILPRPKRRCGPRVTQWAVGVTTAPREQATLDECLASMVAAGWSRPRLFVDGKVSLSAAAADLPATHRDPQIGAWPSYYLALGELVMRSPHADAYLLVQDDVVFFQHRLLRNYLESILWPGDRPGLISLFCSRAYTQATAGWHALKEAFVWGAQAIAFSPSAAKAFLSDSQVVHHRCAPGKEGLANIDSLIGLWSQRVGMPVFLPTPSLVQHVGHVSTLWPTVRARGNRRANQFIGNAARST